MLKLPFEFTMGEYASNTYYKDTYNNNIIFQLTVDWTYDAAYFYHKNHSTTILSLGPATEQHQIDVFIKNSMYLQILQDMVYYTRDIMKTSTNLQSKQAIHTLYQIVESVLEQRN